MTSPASVRAADPTPPPRALRWFPRLGWPAWFVLMVANRHAGTIAEIVDACGCAPPSWLTWVGAAVLGALDTFALFAAVRLTARFPIGWGPSRRYLRVHALAALTYALVVYVVDSGVARALSPAPMQRLLSWWLRLVLDLISYGLLVGLAHAVEYARRYRRTEAAQLRLRAELSEAGRRRAEAELRALKAELSPHFLASALQDVSHLMRADPAAADRVLAQLGELLRSALARAATQEVTLREEIEDLDPYLAVERTRLDGGLTVEWDVAPETLEALVPDMILQPLVENAVKHGLAPRHGGGVRISARRVGARGELLELRVTDDGVGLPAGPLAPPGPSSGLTNARARLAELYGPTVGLELAPGPGGGAVARVILPWHDVEAPDESVTGEATRAGAVSGAGGAPRWPTGGPADASAGAAPRSGRRWMRWAALGLCLVALWALAASIARQLSLPTGGVPPLGVAIAEGLVLALTWMAVGYVAIRLTRSHPVVAPALAPAGVPIGSPSRRHALVVHGAAAVSLAVVQAGIKALFSWAAGYLITSPLWPRVMISMTVYIGLYAVVAGIAHAVEYLRRYRRTEAAQLRLRAELGEAGRRRAEAELRALKAELNPHFLGNALHAVSALMRTDLTAADRVLAQLGELLRSALARTATQEVTLREELDGLKPFLAIEQARLGDQLVVTWDVDDAALDARVPHMILQPLVENAVKHGLAPRRGPGRIEVAAHLDDGRLELSVRDDGVGLDAAGPSRSAARHRGVGLANTRARLSELYGSAASLELRPSAGGGAVARLSLPLTGVEPLNAAAGGARPAISLPPTEP